MRTDRIPLTVGVTGHRAIRPEDEPALAAGVKRELSELKRKYPHSPLVMLNSLAEGADQLCAQAAQLASDFAENGFNDSSASDLGVAFLSLSAAIRGAWLNVLINISSIKDQAFADEYRTRGQALLDSTLPLCDAGYEKVLGMVK